MIVFDLQCGRGHRFEGWFRSGADFERQAADHEVACPLCEDTNVCKAPMAPHVARRAGGGEAATAAATPETADRQRLRDLLGQLRRRIEATCDYVGPAFPEEARRIHYGEIDRRAIYGEASDRETRELEGEGIAVQRIPWLPRRDD